MSTRVRIKQADPVLAVESVSRKPQQGRSKASLERMLAAAQRLMIERGSEEFTLQEVSKVGNVSIGSIYLRFESKDNLVRAVIADELERIIGDEDAMIAKVLAASTNLAEFIPHYVEDFAEILRFHAPLLRLSMLRAAYDPLIAEPGKRSAFRSVEIATAAMLRFKAEFGGTDCERKAAASYQIIFATLARQLSLGSTGESVHGQQDWTLLKIELGRMCLAYLKSAD
ncbi:TetR/AcrR family transcriptional regulator [Novosphingobium sp. FKTRR1]|uniref:TetR/AcrR family transcriptional regulator n=1 Tax=unclassified Novosphingobium TaxID=2644732 RepID=UPI001CF09847|nr:TetR/AcrR family transcriptional regulator [Novosphingobium sp. FKTRR1]